MVRRGVLVLYLRWHRLWPVLLLLVLCPLAGTPHTTKEGAADPDLWSGLKKICSTNTYIILLMFSLYVILYIK